MQKPFLSGQILDLSDGSRILRKLYLRHQLSDPQSILMRPGGERTHLSRYIERIAKPDRFREIQETI